MKVLKLKKENQIIENCDINHNQNIHMINYLQSDEFAIRCGVDVEKVRKLARRFININLKTLQQIRGIFFSLKTTYFQI